MSKVSIIITTKNEEKVIENLLKSINNQSFKDYEIVLVDNSSCDNTIQISKKYGARIFNKGPERSCQRNFGVNKSKGEYVLVLDADMVLTKKVLEKAVKLFTSDKQISAIIVPEKSYGQGFWTKFKVFEREFYVGEDSMEAARFFRKDIFEKYKGYDENMTGPEDFDLPLRMKKNGEKIGRIRSFIYHNEKNYSPFLSAKKKYYYALSVHKYLKRHPEMISVQANMVFRPVFLKKWRKIIKHPFLSLGMFFIKFIEMSGAFLGYVFSR